MKARIFLTAIVCLTISLGLAAVDVVEEIYAVVNDEAITGTELKKFETGMVRSLQAQLQGDKLEQAVQEFKKELLDRFIDQKLVLSKIKEKNYNVDSDVETIIQEIRKQNNIASEEDLINALKAEGIDFAEWKEQWRERRKQERLIWEEVGSKIKVDNPQIMEYYRKNMEQFTLPAEITLNCLYLKKSEDGVRPQEKMDLIAAELKPGLFEPVAKKYSELPGAADNIALGKFKKGELDANLEEVALTLKKTEYSDWIETETGWYIIQVEDFIDSRFQEVKDVREDIIQKLREDQQQVKMKDYISQLKKESHIKILKDYQ